MVDPADYELQKEPETAQPPTSRPPSIVPWVIGAVLVAELPVRESHEDPNTSGFVRRLELLPRRPRTAQRIQGAPGVALREQDGAPVTTPLDPSERLVFVGVPCYPLFRRFTEMFGERGGTFVHSTYLWFASGGANTGYACPLEDPIEGLAEGLLVGARDAMDSMFFHTRSLLAMVRDWGADGVVYHPIKSCRTVSTGLADSRRALMAAADVPSLFIESDMMDRRVVSEAQLKDRIDAFFEGLASRRHQAAIGR